MEINPSRCMKIVLLSFLFTFTSKFTSWNLFRNTTHSGTDLESFAPVGFNWRAKGAKIFLLEPPENHLEHHGGSSKGF